MHACSIIMHSHLRQHLGLDKADHQGSEVGLGLGFGKGKLMGVKGLMRKVKGEVVPNVAISLHSIPTFIALSIHFPCTLLYTYILHVIPRV